VQERIGQLFGNYEILSLLGVGGFAEVYLAENRFLGTFAAIKVMKDQMDAQDLGSFLREARTIATLKHPNILRVLDFGIDPTPYIVLEYAAGGTLRECHPAGTTVPLPTIASYVKQIAAALQYAHDQKQVHRDVKPENMLVQDDGTVVLSDFGIAVMIQNRTISRSAQDVVGTITYMAPEQINGKARPASDQYSLAVVVYEWLCGARLFAGATFIEIAVKHCTEPPPSLRSRVPTIPEAVEQVVLKALAKEPQQRFESIRAFANALELAIAGSASVKTPPSIDLAETILASSSNLQASAETILATPPYPQPVAPGTRFLTYKEHSGSVVAVTWSPDGTRIASGSFDKTVHVWNATTGETLYTYTGHSSPVVGAAWSPKGQCIASCSWDGTVQTWDAATGQQVYPRRNCGSIVLCVAWSPDGKLLAAGCSDRTARVWQVSNMQGEFIYRGHTRPVLALAWPPRDSTRLASGSGDSTVQVWNAMMGERRETYNVEAGEVKTVAWSPDGSRIAFAPDDKRVLVWSPSRQGVFSYLGHQELVYAVAWSPDGSRIASASDDKTVQIWNATNGQLLYTYTGHSQGVYAVAWSPDGTRIASAGYDETVQVWSVYSEQS